MAVLCDENPREAFDARERLLALLLRPTAIS